MKILFGLILFFLFIPSSAQLLNKLKDKVTAKAKNEVSNAKNAAKNKAREAAHKELDDFNAEFDSTDIDYAILLSDNSGVFAGKGRGEFGAKFLRLGNIANSLYKDADLNDEENARLNLQLGQSAYATGRYVFAEKRLNAAKYYFEKGSLTNDLGYMKTISCKGLLYTSMGRFALAERFEAAALKLRKEKTGNANMGVAASLNNYAVLDYNIGRYNEAEKEFDTAISLIQENRQEASIAFAIVLNNKAMLFQSMGRYEAAVKMLQNALQLSDKPELSKSKSYLKFYSNLALLYQEMGKYNEAESIYNALEKKLENGKTEYANMLNNLAILYLLMNRDDKVEEMLKRSSDIYKTIMGEKSPAYAKVISDLGNYYRYKERYDEAGKLLEDVLKIREQTLGVNHPLFVQTQEDLAILFWKQKEYNKAYLLYHEVMEKSLDFINKYFPPMSESEKDKYWDILSPRFQRFFNFAVEANATIKDIVVDMFEYRLATKGILLRSTRKVSEIIMAGGNEQLINAYFSWIDLKEQLTTLYAYSKEELKEQSINIDSLVSAANTLEKKLSENSNEFQRFYFAGKPAYTDVKNVLISDQALIEIIRLRNFDQVFTDECRYVGLVVTKNNPQPVLVILPGGTDMETRFSKTYRISMKNKIQDEKSYSYYWEPFEVYVNGKNKIYVSLDGVYNQINLNTLKKPGGDYLINLFDISLLGNSEDIIIKSENDNNISKKATLFGFPDYGVGAIPELPATKTEVDEINKLLKSSGYQVAEYIQRDATESNLKSAQNISILHIATHGYFLKNVDKASWPIGVHADYAKENVLLRSGLMLTGASEADKHLPGLESRSNGILTSYEAMNLDLKGTNLVVLSACETGLGEVKAGEGVYGLQRAFLAAGAKAIIMSLWKVDDAATQQLMNNFYKNWLATGNMQKAFRQAQQQLMTKFKEPYYWGAFIMMEE